MRIAFFGGSFDPPHQGHIAIAQAAQRALHLDQVLFAPVGLQPLKPSGSSAGFEDRVAMTRLAIAQHPAFELSLADAPQPAHPNLASKPNYTIDTLTKLRQQHPPGTDWFLLLGADSFRTLHHWHRAAEIPFAATLVIASRPNEDLSALPSLLPASVIAVSPIAVSPPPTESGQPLHYKLRNLAGSEAKLILLPDLHYDISATAIRQEIHRLATSRHNQQLAQQLVQPELIAPPVLAYILEHHLYA